MQGALKLELLFPRSTGKILKNTLLLKIEMFAKNRSDEQ